MAESKATSRVQRLLETIMQQHKLIGSLMLGLAVILVILFILVGFQQDDDSRIGVSVYWAAWPEALGAVCLAIVALGFGAWLLMAPPKQLTLTNTRIALLATGGLFGLVIFLATLGRVGRWWSDIFTGGLAGWKGEGGWKLWLCIGVALIGLVIMFVSMLLARTEERANVYLRRLLYGYNAVLSGLLLLAILVLANIMVHFVWPGGYKWTKTRGLLDISTQSKNILANLKEKIWVYVIMAENSRVYENVRTLLENCQAGTDKLEWQTISPDTPGGKVEFEKLRRRLPALQVQKMVRGQFSVPDLDIGRGLAVVQGDPSSPGEKLITFIPERRLYDVEGDPRPGQDKDSRTFVFKGEDVLLSEIKYWLEGSKSPKIYFTQDNEEPDLNKFFASLKSHLERSKYQVLGLRLRALPEGRKPDPQIVYSKEVPKDAAVVVITQPHRAFSAAAQAALRRYVKKNGRLFILLGLDLDPRTLGIRPTGLEKLLSEYNVEVRKAYLYSSKRPFPFVAAFAREESNNRLARAMGTNGLLLPFARPLQRLSTSRNFQVDTVLQVPPREDVLVVDDMTTLRLRRPTDIPGFLAQLGKRIVPSNDPIPVAVAVKDARVDQPHMVVCGNMEFATLSRGADPIYYDFVANSLQWLRGRVTTLGEQPLKSNRFTLNVAKLNQSRMVFLPPFLITICIIGLGVGIWLVRRR
jgi:hypothetical protein